MSRYRCGDKIYFDLGLYTSEKEDTGEIVEGLVFRVDKKSSAYVVGIKGKMFACFVPFDKVVSSES